MPAPTSSRAMGMSTVASPTPASRLNMSEKSMNGSSAIETVLCTAWIAMAASRPPVRHVAQGKSLIDPSLTAKVLERVRNGPATPPELASLTDQERILLGHIAEGLTNRQIAEQMFLAEKTVKNYVSSILSKLGLERRTQAAVLASKLLGGH